MNGEVGVCKNIRVDLIEAGKYDSDVLDDAKCVVTSDFTDYVKYPELKTVSVEYPWASVRQLDQAYALTIHKSQGSQYKAIVMVMLPVSRESFLMKQLPYTGITRAEKVVRIVNVQGSLERFINGHGVIQRYSLLSNLIEVSQEKEIM